MPVGTESATYIDSLAVEAASFKGSEIEIGSLEERAHQKHVLLSSDAIRHFIKVAGEAGERVAHFDLLLQEAKTSFPSEDGWTVLNLSRMQELCEKVLTNPAAPEKLPMGHSELLAEAIITGEVNEAYKMIEHRPMVALAEAVSKIDAVYREKKGEHAGVVVSDGLRQVLANVSEAQLKQVLESLTTALDGVHTDERTAVKMAIMNAVNATNS